MGLLDHITATSLDEDYAHASQQRSGRGRRDKGRPGTTALVVLAVFGALVATAAVQTARNADESASSRESLITQVDGRKTQLAQRRGQVRTLQNQVSTLQSRNLATTAQGRTIASRLSRLGVATGSSAARGPGIQVVVDDARGATSFKQRVQGPDLQKLVNALWLVGAEAISINGQRLTSLTAIRDAGSAVGVNFVSLRRPYTVSAIGNQKTMAAQLLDTKGGQTWVTLQSTFGLQFDVDTKDSMLLPPAKVSLRSAHLPGAGR